MEDNEQKQIDDYRRVEAFLADPAVKEAIRKLDQGFYAAFKNASTPEKREEAWAKTAALEALSGELLATMSGGQLVLKKREQREQQEERARASLRPRNQK